MRFLSIVFSFLICCLAYAIPADQVTIPPGSRIAIMVGTYSPPHRRHHEHFQRLLDSGEVDYVLVIPNDANFHKPLAISAETRLGMLDAAYTDNPRILTPQSISNLGFPLATNIRKYISNKFPDVHWYGAVGKDSALSKGSRVLAHTQDVEKWFVLTPDDNDEASIPKKYGGKSTVRIYSPTENDIRSSDIRAAAQNQDRGALEKLVFPTVADYIIQNGLYSSKDPKPRPRDYLIFCIKTLAKYRF